MDSFRISEISRDITRRKKWIVMKRSLRILVYLLTPGVSEKFI
jgi:hypothetical protein